MVALYSFYLIDLTDFPQIIAFHLHKTATNRIHIIYEVVKHTEKEKHISDKQYLFCLSSLIMPKDYK